MGGTQGVKVTLAIALVPAQLLHESILRRRHCNRMVVSELRAVNDWPRDLLML